MQMHWHVNGRRICTIEHDGHSIDWDTGILIKIDSVDEHITSDINAYWATLPEVQQESIYKAMATIKETMMVILEPKELVEELTKNVEELYRHMECDRILEWVGKGDVIKIPDDIKSEYDLTATEGPNTYLRGDYTELHALIVMLRPMGPIWGEYMKRTKGVDANILKEYRAVRLISTSDIIRTRPYSRLFDFMAHYTETSGSANGVNGVISGIGSEMLPDWLMAINTVRRLTFVASSMVGSDTSPSNIVGDIWTYSKNRIENILNKGDGAAIKVKRKAKKTGDDVSSDPERYKMKENINEGEIASLGIMLSNVERVVKCIDPTVPDDLIELVVKHSEKHGVVDPDEAQIVLMGWTIDEYTPAKSIRYVDHDTLRSVCRICQILLWHWELYDLAVLAHSEPVVSSHRCYNTGSPRTPLTKTEVATLNEIYRGNVLIPGSAVAAGTQKRPTKPVNIYMKSFEMMADHLDSRSWVIHGPAELLSKCTMVLVDDGYAIPKTLYSQLAKLISIIHNQY